MRRSFSLFWLPLCTLILSLAVAPAQAAILHDGLAAQLEVMDDDDLISVIIIMEHQAPVAELNELLKEERATLKARHEEVITALKDASNSQAGLLSELSQRQALGDVAGYTSYWISNLVVAEVTKAYVYALTARSDIAQIESNFTVSLIEPIIDDLGLGENSRGIGVSPGLRVIRADEVWYELGITGAGTIQAGCDTGVDGTHPALGSRWRGNNGHPASECWLSVLNNGHDDFPYDGYGHGTHVMGTQTGLAPDDTVGVAWGALWIACDAINQGVGSGFDNDVIQCYQWLADPDGNPETNDDVPDVVQNSWRINEGFGGDYTDCDSRWWAVIDGCEAAGCVSTWSAGNEGPSATSIGSPADRATTLTNCFSVGAIDGHSGYPYDIAGFSSRGPTGCDVPPERKLKPEVCAPGVSVYSSVPGGGYSSSYSGTSMAGPHVAGVVALMREANPDADVDLIKEILMDTCVDHGSAGEDNTFGWGVIDAYEAVLAVMADVGTLAGTARNASYGYAPIANVAIEVVEADRTTDTAGDGTYSMLVTPGTYTVQATHPSFATVTVPGVDIYLDTVTTLDFDLTDNVGPGFADVTEHRSTDDNVGPYVTDATVTDFSAVDTVTLYYRVNGGAWQTVPMAAGGGDTFSGDIPGQSYVSHVEYYFRATDVAGNTSYNPLGAPGNLYDFYVAQRNELLTEDVESGSPDWTHGIVDPGFSDQWHISSEMNYTPGGLYSWKCGDTGAGEYANLLDAGLVTPAIELGIDSELNYWQWIDAETSGAYPDHCYDGGLVEISLDGGPFVQIFPEGGYTYLIREGGTPGPFPAETEVFSGSFDWHQVTFDLSAFEGDAQIRFRFGSDGASAGEGWYVDDVMIDGFLLDYSGIEDQRALSSRLILRAADPNPFSQSTTLRYQLPGASDVLLQIFDMNGRLVRTLVEEAQQAGPHTIEWDGQDGASQPVATGVYFTRIKTDRDGAATKIIVTR